MHLPFFMLVVFFIVVLFVKRYKIMKSIRIYSYYSRSHRAWAHIKAYTKHEALVKARLYDPFIKFSDLSLLMQNGRYV